jgi:aromatic ring-cleaving dioxygenase
MGFHMKTPNPVLKVLNKFGSLVPLVLLSHMGLLVLVSPKEKESMQHLDSSHESTLSECE